MGVSRPQRQAGGAGALRCSGPSTFGGSSAWRLFPRQAGVGGPCLESSWTRLGRRPGVPAAGSSVRDRRMYTVLPEIEYITDRLPPILPPSRSGARRQCRSDPLITGCAILPETEPTVRYKTLCDWARTLTAAGGSAITITSVAVSSIISVTCVRDQ